MVTQGNTTQVLWTCREIHPLWVLFVFMFFAFLGPRQWHMEVPRLGVESDLQLPDYTTATATPDLSHICNLRHSSQQYWILNPLRGARDGTHILTDACRVHYC